MQLYRENIIYPSSHLIVKEEYFDFNDFPFHYHTEFELIYIIKGSGQRFVGDNIAAFNSGELYFFGGNLPHTFYNKHQAAARDIHQIVIQFREDFLGADFFKSSSFKQVKLLLDNSKRGICFGEDTVTSAGNRLRDMVHMDETAAVIELLIVLDNLSKCRDQQFLASTGYQPNLNVKDTERMIAVYDYIFNHFGEDISMNQVASVACLSPEAFCRYFKKYTRKTFSEFLIEIRIGNACKLLQENKMDIQQISIHCGFNSISYFNRKFKSVTGQAPAEYRHSFAVKSFDLSNAEMFRAIRS